MSQRPSVFDLFLPGIVGGMILAMVALQLGDVVFHDAFQQIFPHPTFLLLAVGIGMASTVGLVTLFPHSRGNDEKARCPIPCISKNENDLSPGGTDVL